MVLRWINKVRIRLIIFSMKPKTQIVVPPLIRSIYNGDHKKRNKMAPHQIKMWKSFISTYQISFLMSYMTYYKLEVKNKHNIIKSPPVFPSIILNHWKHKTMIYIQIPLEPKFPLEMSENILKQFRTQVKKLYLVFKFSFLSPIQQEK